MKIQNIDLLIINVPFLKLIPQTGPALIKASVERAGFSCKVIDWNYELYKELSIDYDKYNVISLDLSMREEICSTVMNNIISMTERILEYNPKWIGLSVYGRSVSSSIIEKICISLKKNLSDSKIVVGGHAVTVVNLGSYLLRKNLVDCYICGEGERVTISLLRGDSNIPGYNGRPFKQIDDINEIPSPDYSDTPPSAYPYNEAFLITSRGCVNNCIYCENYFKKFRYRRPEIVVKEIIELHEKYGVENLTFSDSISNGNVKQLREICSLISKRIPLIKWKAFMGCFPKRIMNSEVYELMRNSGCEKISLGIESGSERLRRDMNKRFSNDDLRFMIEQCHKNKIKVGICLIMGLYTETDEDHKETLKFLSDIVKFKEYIELDSFTTMFLPSNKKTKFDDQVLFDEADQWYYQENTFPVRVRHWVDIIEHCIEVGFDNVPIHFKWGFVENLKKYKRSSEVRNLLERLETLYNMRSIQ